MSRSTKPTRTGIDFLGVVPVALAGSKEHRKRTRTLAEKDSGGLMKEDAMKKKTRTWRGPKRGKRNLKRKKKKKGTESGARKTSGTSQEKERKIP